MKPERGRPRGARQRRRRGRRPLTVDDADPNAGGIQPVSAPSHGTLALNEDGSFTYTPNQTFGGEDSFTYKANDGFTASNAATVTITVGEDKTAPTVTGVTPADKATKVARNANVTATFSE